MVADRYIVKIAGAENRTVPSLREVLAKCPEGYRLHSVVPHASGGGYTLHFNAIFELEALAPTPAERQDAAT